MVLLQMAIMEVRVQGPPRNRSLSPQGTKMKASRAASASRQQKSLPHPRRQHRRAQWQATPVLLRAGQLRQRSLLPRPVALLRRELLLVCQQALRCRAAPRTVSNLALAVRRLRPLLMQRRRVHANSCVLLLPLASSPSLHPADAFMDGRLSPEDLAARLLNKISVRTQ